MLIEANTLRRHPGSYHDNIIIIIGMYMCVCEGVFVMVTMAVSAVSVIESIVVIRLCSHNSSDTPVPSVVRFLAFRVLGRVLCVSCPSTKVSPAGRGIHGSSLPGDRSLGLNVDDRELNGVTRDPVKRRNAVDDVLIELRKVDSLFAY